VEVQNAEEVDESSAAGTDEWAADEPAQPVIATLDEFSLTNSESEELSESEDQELESVSLVDSQVSDLNEMDSLDAEFEDDASLASASGIAADLAREPVTLEATLSNQDGKAEPVTAEPNGDVVHSSEIRQSEFEVSVDQSSVQSADSHDGIVKVRGAEDEFADIINLGHEEQSPASSTSFMALPQEVLRFMEEMKQALNGLTDKVQDLADVKSQVADLATQVATQAAQAAVERLLEEEARRRSADEVRRLEDQRRYEEEITALREAAERVSAAAERNVSEQVGGVVNPLQFDTGLSFSAVQRQVYDMLLDWNIGHYHALELLNVAIAGLEPGGQPSFEGLVTSVSEEICRNVLLGDGIRLSRTPPGKAVALVGPTGVGKTTTIAKLAAHFAFHQGKRVSLISMDNYRIAAAEQLRTYADIMGLDLDIVFSKDEFDKVLSSRRNSDLILIDTAGRSPNNTKHLQELREIFMAHPPDEVHLVINAGTRRDDMKLILDAFKPLSYDHLIVSKLDETRSLGALYNLTRACTLPISYFAVGQSVPEDIRTATLPFIKQWIAQGRIL
jgi:flagellar biosynthesis GTPase FlhF